MEKPHIAFLCSRLDLPGGTERAIVNTANLLFSKGYEITLVVLDEIRECFYSVEKGIKVLVADMNFGIVNNGSMLSRKISFITHIKKLKGVLNLVGASIIISTEYQFTIGAFFALRNSNKRIFSWEHHHFHWLNKNKFWTFLFNKIYPRIHKVICLNETESVLFKQVGCTASVIPNFTSQSKKASLEKKTVLSVGWLIKRKGVDIIPSIAEIVFYRHPDWKWRIIGSGEEYDNLKHRIEESHLAHNITIILPSSPELEQEYLNASIFVMTSRFECFPMVLLEAMSHGVPCISYNCPTGPADIIKHGEDGLLVETEDIVGMADAICRLIENEELRKKMGENAHRNVLRFSPENIFKLWDAVLQPTTKHLD